MRDPSPISFLRRLELLGMRPKELRALDQLDRRIASHEALTTDGAVIRLRRWVDAGQPDADVADLPIAATSELHAAIRATIARCPIPVRHHAVHGTAWFGLPRGSAGVFWRPPRMPTPEHDRLHAIIIDGNVPADSLPANIAHELGHSWTAEIDAETPAPNYRGMSTEAALAIGSALGHDMAELRAIFEGNAHLREVQADALARLWGFPINSCGRRRRDAIRKDHDTAERSARAALEKHLPTGVPS